MMNTLAHYTTTRTIPHIFEHIVVENHIITDKYLTPELINLIIHTTSHVYIEITNIQLWQEFIKKYAYFARFAVDSYETVAKVLDDKDCISFVPSTPNYYLRGIPMSRLRLSDILPYLSDKNILYLIKTNNEITDSIPEYVLRTLKKKYPLEFAKLAISNTRLVKILRRKKNASM